MQNVVFTPEEFNLLRDKISFTGVEKIKNSKGFLWYVVQLDETNIVKSEIILNEECYNAKNQNRKGF